MENRPGLPSGTGRNGHENMTPHEWYKFPTRQENRFMWTCSNCNSTCSGTSDGPFLGREIDLDCRVMQVEDVMES